MKKIIFAILNIAVFSFEEGLSQPTSYIDSLYSVSLDRTKSFSIVLPSSYNPSKRYPVLYLLHGYGGNHLQWLDITKYVDDFPIIAVMPDGENSFYVNSYIQPQNRFEDYLIHELPKYIQQKYAIDTTQQAIAGYSMGGYGALMLALKYPKRFWFAASLSGAITVPRDIEIMKHDPLYSFVFPALTNAFGERPNAFRTEHDLFHLYKNTSPDSLPYCYLIIGIQDEFPTFLPRHRELAESLRVHGASYEYHEIPGTHSRQNRYAEIQMALRRMQELMQRGFRSLADAVARTISKKGIDQAVKQFYDLRNKQADFYYVDEGEINRLGYQLLRVKKIKEAIAVFTLNVEAFPESSNVYDSLGEAYMISGNKELAIKNYRKSLALDPQNTNAIDMLNKLNAK